MDGTNVKHSLLLLALSVIVWPESARAGGGQSDKDKITKHNSVCVYNLICQ